MRFLIALAALAQQDAWKPIDAKIEQVGDDVHLSFQPIDVTKLRVGVAFERAQLHGPDGKVAAKSEGGVIALEKKSGVAEIVLFKAKAQGLKLEVPAGESERKPAAPKEADLEEIGEFKPTFYWVLQEEKFDGERDTPLLDPEGKELGRFPKEFVRQAKIEGTAKLRDGRVVNVVEKGWRVVDAPHGLGAGGFHLIPFRSVAVDRTEIPLGTKLFIKEAVGMKLPDGTTHDGVFWAHDVGGAIKGKRIDLFTGLGRRQDVYAKAGIENMKPLKLRRFK
jgi:3D (Asp-Asp-Asp) domain-containing protein